MWRLLCLSNLAQHRIIQKGGHRRRGDDTSLGDEAGEIAGRGDIKKGVFDPQIGVVQQVRVPIPG